MSLQFNGTNGITYPNGTLQSTAYTGSSSGGGGGGDYTPEAMVWEDKKAERGFDTLYTNTNDVPLYVQIYCYTLGSEAAENWKFEIDGVNFGYNGVNTVGSINQTPMFIIPAGSTYKAVLDAGFPVISKWNEALMPVAVGTGGGGTGDAYTKEESDAIDNAQDVKIVINNDDIARQQIEITNNTAEIGKNTSAINTNIINIAQNSEDIAELQDSIFFSSAYSANYPSAANRDPEDGNMYLQAFALFTYSYASATQIFCSKTDEAGNVRQFTAIKAGDSVVLNEVDSPNYGRYELVSIEEVSESYVVMNVIPKLGEGTIVAGVKVAFQAFPKVGVWDEVDGEAVYDGDIEVNGVTVGKGNSSGTGNTALGVNALQKETTGNYNTAVGSQSLQNSKTGGANTAVGHSSLAGVISGDKNSAVGKSAGNTLTTGINNIILGWNAQPSAPNVSNEVTIGNADTATIRMGNGDILYPLSGGGSGGDYTPEPMVWEDKLAERAWATDYVNPYDVPLYLQIGAASTDTEPCTWIVTIDGISMGSSGKHSGDSSAYNTSFFTVPAGGTYIVTKTRANTFTAWNEAKMPVAVGTGGIPEAPVDGKQYGRQDAEWTEVVGGDGGGTDGYTKAEVDAQQDAQDDAIADNATNIATNTTDIAKNTTDIAALPPYVDAYSKTATDTLLDAKANKEDTYTKAETDVEIAAAGGGGDSIWTEVDGVATYNGTIDVESMYSIQDIIVGDYKTNAAYGINIGHGSGKYLTNLAMGYQALGSSNTGSQNMALGYQALKYNTSGKNNLAMGYQSLGASSTGQDNTALGMQSSYGNWTGNYNSSFGKSSLLSNNEGNSNTAIGESALAYTKGDNNTALGAKAGDNIISGSNNIVIGYNANASSGTVSNEVTIGNDDITKTRLNGNVVTTGGFYGNGLSLSDGTGISYDAPNDSLLYSSNAGNRWLIGGSTSMILSKAEGENATLRVTGLSEAVTTASPNLCVNSSGVLQRTTGTSSIWTDVDGDAVLEDGFVKVKRDGQEININPSYGGAGGNAIIESNDPIGLMSNSNLGLLVNTDGTVTIDSNLIIPNMQTTDQPANVPNCYIGSTGQLVKQLSPTLYSIKEIDEKLATKDKIIEALTARLTKLEKRIK